MRVAVLSDIHSNLEALTTALEEIRRRSIDHIVCLGDVVGYGADAAACVDLIRERAAMVVAGNHDLAVAVKIGDLLLPKDAQAAANHNRDQLSESQRTWLGDLPLVCSDGPCTFVHSTPRKPEAWRRLGSLASAREQFKYFDNDVCFIGHTHVPGIFADRIGVLSVRRGHRFLINVGSVGQPRDGDPRLAFGLFDTDTFRYESVRLSYDVERAALKVKQAGLPVRLAERLREGV